MIRLLALLVIAAVVAVLAFLERWSSNRYSAYENLGYALGAFIVTLIIEALISIVIIAVGMLVLGRWPFPV